MASYDYDLIVIGGGAGGLTAAGIAANAGVKTMLVERHRLGGDCTWTGCIPSKTLLHSADVAQSVRTAGESGIASEGTTVDFGVVMRRVRRVREEIYSDADDPAIYEAYGIDVAQGKARFLGPRAIEIESDAGTRCASARMFVIATGSRVAIPSISGLEDVPHLTNETLFELEAQPNRLTIIGAGPVGIEMAQAFTRLGTEVTVVEMADRILPKDDDDHGELLKRVLEEEGIRFTLDASAESVERVANGIAMKLKTGDTITADALLVATGRRPNTENIGLEEAGVTFSEKGIRVDEKCRTSQRHIFAVGDCTGEYQLTHMSEHMAKVAMSNAVLKLPMRIDRKHVPWATFTSPEIAQIGKTEQQLRKEGASFEIYRFPYTKVDRAITDEKSTGQIKVFASRWRGKIFGASIIGERAGELISIYAVAMRNGVSLKALSDTILPYPSYGLAARRAADQWYARLQFPWTVRLLQRVFRYRGQVPPKIDRERIV